MKFKSVNSLVFRPFSFEKGLIASFVFLGPLGNLLTPHFLPPHFRTYFFLLLGFPLFFTRIREEQLKTALFFTPFFLYAFLSAIYTNLYGHPNEPFPIFRYLLLLFHFLFVVGASSIVHQKEELLKYLDLYVKAYLISLGIGFVFFIGFYTNWIPFSLIERFSVLAQFGYGLLRFSPGSYPNEYGIVTSFVLSILTLLSFEKKALHKLMPAAAIALFLTTTRAAFISYFVGLLLIAIWKRKVVKTLALFLLSTCIFLSILSHFHIDGLHILKSGFLQRIHEGSLGERYLVWLDSLKQFQEEPFAGIGFASVSNIHNVYLQLFFELGLFGSLILLGTFFFWSLEKGFIRSKNQDPDLLFLKRVQILGLIHVLWFAASNHNLNHHLTWFVIFLCASQGTFSRAFNKFTTSRTF